MRRKTEDYYYPFLQLSHSATKKGNHGSEMIAGNQGGQEGKR